MNQTIEDYLNRLEAAGNRRRLSADTSHEVLLDFTSNDYLGLARNTGLQREFLDSVDDGSFQMSASASRLLSAHQDEFMQLEESIAAAYGSDAATLVLNSGYHANSGIIPALCSDRTVIIADKLVHASIIDGIRLSGKPFSRFRHNDLNHLEHFLTKAANEGLLPLVIVESVYSMDGDSPDFDGLAALKERYPGMFLYIDEAHAIGVCGPEGLGMARSFDGLADVVIGTFGKALASVGAFAVVSRSLKEYLINTTRSFIFSTALPPLSIRWNRIMFEKIRTMDAERHHLAELGARLAPALGPEAAHIQCKMVGDPMRAVALSQQLREDGILALPIRHPTVPAGTDRLRVSLSAAHTADDIDKLISALQ